MDKKKLYGKGWIGDELMGFPLMLYTWFKGDKIGKLLNERISKAKEKANNTEVNLAEIDEHKIEYDELDNFFSHYFKKIEGSEHKSIEEKIEYCLSKYKKEAKSLFSSSKLMILQENFLNGAEKTLFLYYILQKQKELKDIQEKEKEGLAYLMGEEMAEKLKGFLKKENLIGENKKPKGEKAIFIRLHTYLREKHFINPTIKGIVLIREMEKEYRVKFDPSVISRADFVKINKAEKETKKRMINYLGD